MSYKKSYKNDENKKDPLTEITDKLETGIKELINSDKYKTYLNTMSKFHNYSFNNTLLIAMQKPDATLVSGYASWKTKFNRQVKKGEKGIKILAPAPVKKKVYQNKLDNDGNLILGKDGQPVKEMVEVTVPKFKVTTVFDISSTEGQELPTVGVNELKGNVHKFNDLMDALKHISPVPVETTNIESGAKGYFSPGEQKICIQEGMSEAQTLKTMLHELGHCMLHDKDHERMEGLEGSSKKNRGVKELEAESIAYVCGMALTDDLDSSEYSFSYIAGWANDKDVSELKESLDTIRKTADHIITSVESYLEERDKQREELVQIANEDEQLNAERVEADKDAEEVKAEDKKDTAVRTAVAITIAAGAATDIGKGIDETKEMVSDGIKPVMSFKEQIADAKSELAESNKNKAKTGIEIRKNKNRGIE